MTVNLLSLYNLQVCEAPPFMTPGGGSSLNSQNQPKMRNLQSLNLKHTKLRLLLTGQAVFVDNAQSASTGFLRSSNEKTIGLKRQELKHLCSD